MAFHDEPAAVRVLAACAHRLDRLTDRPWDQPFKSFDVVAHLAERLGVLGRLARLPRPADDLFEDALLTIAAIALDAVVRMHRRHAR